MAQYQYTNANVTNGSNEIVLVGVDATTDLAPGTYGFIEFMVTEDTDAHKGVPYTVNSGVVPVYSGGNTTVTLTTNYAGATDTGIAVAFQRDYSSPDNLPLSYPGDLEPSTIMYRIASTVQSLITAIVSGTKTLTNVLITGGSITGITDLAVEDGGTGSSTASDARTALGVAIGSDVQAYDATLTAYAGTLTAANKIPYATALDTAGELDFLDEDDMASDSATAVPSQQSIVAYIASQIAANLAMPAGHINGLLWSNNGTDATNDFDISAGEARSSDNTTDLTLSSSQTKQMDATWATGTNAGAITATAWSGTGWVASTTYHVFLAEISGTVEVIVDTDASGANIDTDHSSPKKRHIFSFLSSAGPTLPTLHTSLDGRNVRAVLDVRLLDVSDTGSTSGALATLSVPTGIEVLANVTHQVSSSSPVYSLLTETRQPNSTPSISLFSVLSTGGSTVGIISTDILTDVSAQIRYRSDAALSSTLGNSIFTNAYTILR